VLVDDLLARAARAPSTIAFADGDDGRVHEAAARFDASGAGRAILLSVADGAAAVASVADVIDLRSDPRRDAFARELARLRADRGLKVADALALLEDPLYFGGMLVQSGVAAGMVAGATRTSADVIRAALRTVGLAPGAERVSSFFLMEPRDGPSLTFADCGVIVQPSAVELADIAVRAALNHWRLTGERPRVAFLSFSTHGSAEADELGVVRAALAMARGRAAEAGLTEADFDGELQVDAALDPSVGRTKAPASAVAGRANVLVFPDLAAGNIGYKLVQRLGGAAAYGPILQGLARPVNDLSRGATAEDVLAVAAITALQAADSGMKPLLQ
jgi:phosphate acetyltransferase